MLIDPCQVKIMCMILFSNTGGEAAICTTGLGRNCLELVMEEEFGKAMLNVNKTFLSKTK